MQINGKDFTVGADPEIFVGKDGAFISAHDLIPGTKREPFVVDKGAVQVDGMAVEFNINPASSLGEFKDNLSSVQSTLKDMIDDKEFLRVASVMFDEEFTKGIPTINLELGCMPDFNGWTQDVNMPPDSTKLMRTVGGHIHIGGFPTDNIYSEEHFATCARLARILDETIGIHSLLWDTDDERRTLYGKAGCFRPKSYGMEYRTLSNAWIFDEELVEFVYEGVKRALTLMFEDYEPNPCIQEVINNSDRSYLEAMAA